MPANYEYCTNCGHTNAFVAPDSAVKPSLPRPTPETPIGGAPTVNMGSMGDSARYTPPPEAAAAAGAAGAAASAWQPGQPVQERPSQPAPNLAPPPSYSPAPVQQSQYAQPPAVYNQPQPPYPYAATPPKDSTVALLLELIGYAGILGIGHIYAGRTTRGIWLLVGWLFYWAIVVVLFITILLAPVACVMFISWPIVPILSGLWIKNDLDKQMAMMRR
jgi:hypothetical protein